MGRMWVDPEALIAAASLVQLNWGTSGYRIVDAETPGFSGAVILEVLASDGGKFWVAGTRHGNTCDGQTKDETAAQLQDLLHREGPSGNCPRPDIHRTRTHRPEGNRAFSMTSAISIMDERRAERAEQVVRKTTLSAIDAWGTTTHYEIEWRSEVVRGVMLGEENVGDVPVVWVDFPPVEAVKSRGTGIVYLKTWPVQVTGQQQQVVEGVRVDTADELQPGTYRVVREWDGDEDDEEAKP